MFLRWRPANKSSQQRASASVPVSSKAFVKTRTETSLCSLSLLTEKVGLGNPPGIVMSLFLE